MAAGIPREASIFAGVCAIFFVVIGVIGNLTTLVALLRCPKVRNHATTAFVLSLCVSDLLFCCFNLSLTAIRYFNEAWILGATLCKIFPAIFYGNVAVSLLSMVGITVNRFILIVFHNLYAQIYKTKYVILQLTSIWAMAFLIMLPPLLGVWGELGFDDATFSCTILKKNGNSIKKYLFLTGFLIPCSVIIISYSFIFITVKKQKLKLESHRSPVLKNKKLKPFSSKEEGDTKLTIMMLTIFLCFLICYLPSMLANVADESNKSYPWFHIFASIMAWASSVINPFVYAASNRNYRLVKLFKCYLWRCVNKTKPTKNKIYLGKKKKISFR